LSYCPSPSESQPLNHPLFAHCLCRRRLFFAFLAWRAYLPLFLFAMIFQFSFPNDGRCPSPSILLFRSFSYSCFQIGRCSPPLSAPAAFCFPSEFFPSPLLREFFPDNIRTRFGPFLMLSFSLVFCMILVFCSSLPPDVGLSNGYPLLSTPLSDFGLGDVDLDPSAFPSLSFPIPPFLVFFL